MKRMELFPLFVVSSELNYGMQAILSTVVDLMPNAFEMEELHAFKGAEGDTTVEIHASDSAPCAAHVFKTMSEPHVGDVTFFRLFSGTIHNGDELYNATRSGVEKLNHLSIAQGKDRIEVGAVGDIGCVAKLRNTHKRHAVDASIRCGCRSSASRGRDQMACTPPIAPTRKAGGSTAHDEDPTFEVLQPETHETIVSGLGERHLEVRCPAQTKFGVTRAVEAKNRLPRDDQG